MDYLTEAKKAIHERRAPATSLPVQVRECEISEISEVSPPPPQEEEYLDALHRPDRPDQPAWDQAEAERLLANILPDWNAPYRPLSLNRLGAAVDAAWDARDLAGLRRAVAELLEAIKQTSAHEPVPAYDINDRNDQSQPQSEEAYLHLVARDVERALGLPSGSTVLVDPHRCNDFCRCNGRPPPK
jgi:hypothetical protein